MVARLHHRALMTVILLMMLVFSAPSANDVAAARSVTRDKPTSGAATGCTAIRSSRCVMRGARRHRRGTHVLGSRGVMLQVGPDGQLVATRRPKVLRPKARAAASYYQGEMNNLGSSDYGTPMCLTTYGVGPNQDGADAHLWTCDIHAGDQYWVLQREWNGWNLEGWQNMCLTNSQGFLNNNNPQTLWACGSPYQEEWTPSPVWQDGEPFTLRADTSSFTASGYCLTTDGNHTNGSLVEIWQCNGSSNQVWSGPLNGGPSCISSDQCDGPGYGDYFGEH
jgi:hypothetical protein